MKFSYPILKRPGFEKPTTKGNPMKFSYPILKRPGFIIFLIIKLKRPQPFKLRIFNLPIEENL